MDNYIEKILCLEILEKISRLRRYLLSNQTSKMEGKEVVGLFIESLKACQDNIWKITEYLKKTSILNYTERASVLRQISMSFSAIVSLHDQLQLVHGSWVRPETYTFINEIINFFPQERALKKVNIVLTNEYNFLEGNLTSIFDDILKRTNRTSINLNEENPTVFLPKLDYDNPLNWAILAHECGHTDTKGIKNLLENPKLTTANLNKEYFRLWAEEIYCDLIASKVLGPAYLASFCTYALLVSGIDGNETHCRTHPASTLRISIIYEYLNSKNIEIPLSKELFGCRDIASYYFKIVEENNKVSRKFLNTFESQYYKSEQFSIDLTEFIDMISEQVDEIVKLKFSLTHKDFERINILKERLSKGITIASYQEIDVLEEARKKYPPKNVDLIELNKGKEALQETRTKLWEIINAGWINKIENLLPYGLELFFLDGKEKTDMNENLELFDLKLESYDRVLLKSIESSEIFKIFEGE